MIEEVQQKIRDGVNRTEIRKFIEAECSVKKGRANEIYREIAKGMEKAASVGVEDSLQFVSDKYCVNKESDTYIINLSCQQAPLVIPGAKIRAIFRSYSGWGENLTVTEICRKFGLTPIVFNEMKRIFGLVKAREPLTAEQVFDNDPDKSAEQILEEKRLQVYQEYEKRSWKETQEEAKKWREFKALQLDPFARFLEEWTPPQYKPVPAPKKQKAGAKYMLINVADIHVGSRAGGRFLYRQREWNYSELEKSMADYVSQIKDEVDDRTTGFEAAYLTIGGDICHTLTGFTDNGTKLESEFLGEDQLDYAFALMACFIQQVLAIFPKVHVKAVGGNHSYLGDYAVNRFLSVYFRGEPRIDFEVTTKRYLPFKVLDTLVVLDHGASGKGIKSKLPRSGAEQNSYVQGIFLDRPEMLIGTKSRIFLTNDKHHYNYVERNHFDLVICPSIVGGDLYSDFNGWASRPSQCIFVLDERGMRETIRLYFD